MSAPSKFKLFTSNFLDLSILANSFVSSEKAGFPVTNAYNLQRRSKVWRSNGYFKILSGSNTIIFNEGGSDLTATIVPGEYTSTASFMAAIDTAFTSAPGASGSYTVTQNGDLKFVITKSSGTFTIKWSAAGSLVMAGILGYDTSSNDTGALSYTADLLRINTEEWIMWDLGLASNPQAFMMCDQRNRPIRLSPAGTFKLQGNETNNFSNPSFSRTLTYDDEVISAISEIGLHTSGLRYWRISFSDQNPLGYLQIGAIFLGDAFAPTRGRVSFGLDFQYVDRTETVYSEGGQGFSDIFEQTQSFNATWQGLQKEDTDSIDSLFRKYGTSSPFFVSMDTDSVYSTMANRRVKFVKFANEPKSQLVSVDNFSCSMQLLEQL